MTITDLHDKRLAFAKECYIAPGNDPGCFARKKTTRRLSSASSNISPANPTTREDLDGTPTAGTFEAALSENPVTVRLVIPYKDPDVATGDTITPAIRTAETGAAGAEAGKADSVYPPMHNILQYPNITLEGEKT